MTIAQIRSHVLSVPRPMLSGRPGRLNSVVVEVETADGRFGFGEALCFATPRGTAAIVEDVFAPRLRGRDETAIAARWDDMRGALVGSMTGIGAEALSAVDIALWDLLGRTLGAPIHRLLGGHGRSRLPAYASFVGWIADDDAAAVARDAVARGFCCVKVKLSPPLALAQARATFMRDVVGPAVDLVADPNGAFSRQEAAQLARTLASLGYLWLEEPIDPSDSRGMADIVRLALLPVAAGENEYAPSGALGLAEMRAVDILQPDCGRIGGITGVTRAVCGASSHGLAFAPHHAGGAIKAAAAMQLAAALPGFTILECSVLRTPLHDAVTRAPVSHPDQLDAASTLPVPQGPGLGIEIDRAALERLTLH